MERGEDSAMRPTGLLGRAIALAVALCVIATACGSSSNGTDPAPAQASGATASTEPVLSEAEAAAATETATEDPAEEGHDSSGNFAGEGDRIAAARESVPVTMDAFLGYSADGAYGYESTGDRVDLQRCDAEPSRRMAGIDMRRSSEDRLVTFAAGPELAGDVMALDVNETNRAVILWACRDEQGRDQHHLRTFTILHGDNVDTSFDTPIVVDPSQQWIRLIGWTDGEAIESTVDLTVTIGEDDDYENWVQQELRYDLETGSFEQIGEEAPLYGNEPADKLAPQVASPDGRFRLRDIADPYGQPGCEGYGVARSISIDDGTGERAAFDFDQPSFPGASDIHFDDTGLVMWWGGCEGYYSAYVARLTDDGRLVDQHLIELLQEPSITGEFSYLEMVQARLLGGGEAGLLLVDRSTDGLPEVSYQRVDFALDPSFVSDRTDLVDLTNPLAATVAGSGQLFAGTSLTSPQGTTPGCGDQTLYATTTTGLVRVLESDFALDSVVDVAVSPVRETDYDGHIVRSRQIAILVECREEYIGGRIWYGTESDIPGNGIRLQRADVPSTVEIVELVEVQDEEYDYVWHTEATLTWREGTTANVRFEPVPQ